MECAGLGPLTYAYTWNEVLQGPIREACARQLDAQLDGTWDEDADGCLEAASLMLNPLGVESLAFALMPRQAAVGGAACGAVQRVAIGDTSVTMAMGDASNAPLAKIEAGHLVCRQVAFEALTQVERTHALLASSGHSLVAVVKYKAEAAPQLGGPLSDRLTPFLALVGGRQPVGAGTDSRCGDEVNIRLDRRQNVRGLFL